MCLCVRESWGNGNFKESGVFHDWVYLKLGAIYPLANYDDVFTFSKHGYNSQ